MAVTRHTYVTRERLRAAGATWNAPTDDDLSDRLIQSHSDKVDELFGRHFYPHIGTRRYDWPSRSQAYASLLWLDADLLSVTAFTASGEIVSPLDYVLGPDDFEAGPYDRIELATGLTFGVGGQRSLVVAGTWGYSNDAAPAGSLAENISDTATSLTLGSGPLVGVGDLLQIGAERILVSDREHVESSMLGEEEAVRTFTVVRGMYGTSAAAHSQGAAVTRNVPPGLIGDLVIAECIAQRLQEEGGYSASLGAGGQTTPDRIALLDLRARAREAYARIERIAL